MQQLEKLEPPHKIITKCFSVNRLKEENYRECMKNPKREREEVNKVEVSEAVISIFMNEHESCKHPMSLFIQFTHRSSPSLIKIMCCD